MRNRQPSRLKTPAAPAEAPDARSYGGPSLREMRLDLGWSQQMAANVLNACDPSLDIKREKVDYLEREGTYNVRIIRAYARVFRRSMAEVEAAAASLKEKNNNSPTPALSS
jgi:hypothetical protein